MTSGRKTISAFAVALFVLVPAASAYAATLTLSSGSTQVTVGSIVTVRVVLNSSDQAVNAAEATLQFPADVLQVTSLSKTSSIFTIWVEDPVFSNTTGQVTFGGGLPTPGYEGTNGTVLGVSFVAKKTGTATLSLSDADVTANDGLGTDVLQNTGTLQLTVTSAPAAQPVAPRPSVPAVPATPAAPAATTTVPALLTTLLQAPLIYNAPSSVPMGEAATVTGSSIYPGATVDLSIQDINGRTQPVVSQSTVAGNGSFTITGPSSFTPGQYAGFVTAQVDGQQSPPSNSFTINFEGPSFTDRLVGILDQTISLVLIGILCGFMLGLSCGYYFLRRSLKTSIPSVVSTPPVQNNPQ